MADTPFIARKGLVSLGDITGSGHLQISTVDGLATATEALFLDSTDTVVSRSLGDSAFQDTGSMTVLNADTATTASHATAVNIGTLTTTGGKNILYTGDGSRVSQDTSGEFTYDPDANQLSVGGIIVNQDAPPIGIDISYTGSRWRQYIDNSGNITLNASGSGNNTNVNYTLEKGHFQLNLKDTGKDFRIRDSGNVTYFVVTGDKKVGIGEAVGISPQQDVEIQGTVRIRDYGTGNKTGTLAYTLGVDSNGDLIETTGGTDTNIANTDLTATANRTLTMGSNNLTFSDVNLFTVDATVGGITLQSTEETFLTGIGNYSKPHVLYWDSSDGRISYAPTGSIPGTTYTAGTGISINGSNEISSTITQATVYTPDVYEIETQNTITATTTLDLAATNTNPTILDGTTGTSRDASQVNAVNFNSTGVFEITYTVNLSHGDPATDNRMNPAIYAKAGDIGPSGTLSEVHGSLNATYIRLPGANNAPNGSIHGKFYYNNTSTQNSVVLFITFLGTTSNPDIDVVNHISGLKNTLTIRKIS